MDLRIPSGGGGFLESSWADDDDDRSFLTEDSADILSDVSPQDVVDALGQLFGGNIEYVGLNGEYGWIQTADTRGGYVFERSVSDDGVVQFPAVLSSQQVQEAFAAFLAGDLDAGLDWAAAPVVAEPKPKRGWFRR